ncbi:MAG: hypothetical protein SWH68_04405 [Thermodesulfobacteriota bacterium]|nr:hypothetical protein [Thermodesulfobacteriota bacterium]
MELYNKIKQIKEANKKQEKKISETWIQRSKQDDVEIDKALSNGSRNNNKESARNI